MASSLSAEDRNPSIESLSINPNEEINRNVTFENSHHHHLTRLSDIGEEVEKDDASSCGSWQAVSEIDEKVQTLEDEDFDQNSRHFIDDYNTFFRAARNGDVETLRAKLDLGLDIEWETSRGFTALVMAIMEMQVEAVQFLLERGTDINHRVKTLPPLVHALTKEERGDELMQLLVDHGVNLKTVSGPDGKDALHWAASEGMAEAVEFLIGKGMDMERTCRRGCTPLILAADNGNTKAAEVLVKHGANLNVRSGNGGTPLIWSSCNNRVETVRFFLERGVDINASDNYGHSAIFLASHFGCLETVNLLLSKGADAFALSKKPENFSAVMGAAYSGHADVIRALVDHGCGLNVKNNLGEDALDLAILEQKPEAIHALLEALGGEGYPKSSVSLEFALAEGHTMIKSLISVSSLMYSHIGLKLEHPGEYAWMEWVLKNGGEVVKPRAMLKMLHAALEEQSIGMVKALADQGCDVNARLQPGHTPLSFAVGHHNVELIQALLDAGADPNKPNAEGLTALDDAIFDMKNGEDTKIVDVLLESRKCRINSGKNPACTAFSYILAKMDDVADWPLGTESLAIRMLNSVHDVNAERCSVGSSLLHVATLREREDFIDLLLRKGADIEATDDFGVTPLILACQHAPKMIPLLIERGANVNAKYKAEGSGLTAAAAHGNVESLEFLVNYGLDIEVLTKKGYPPLACALTWAQEDAAMFLIQKGANVHWKTQNKSQTALHFAAKQKLERATAELLKQGVNVNAKDNDGWTPLHEACATGTPKIVQMLLDAGADIELELPNKDRPLHVALIHEQEIIAHILLSRGADIGPRASRDRTPLHLAAEYNLPVVTILLLDKGASTEDIDEETWTPLCCCGYARVVTILIDRGANVNYADRDNWTPLHQAVSNVDWTIAFLLLRAGAEINVRTTDDGLSVMERAQYIEDKEPRAEFVRMLEDEIASREKRAESRDKIADEIEIVDSNEVA